LYCYFNHFNHFKNSIKMAKGNRPADTNASNDNDLDLLGGTAGTENSGTGAAATEANGTNEGSEAPTVEEVTAKTQEQLTKEAADAEIKKLQEQIKELRQKAKGEKAKKEKVLKGQNVTFTNKAGERITGLGVIYYVVRHGGKLHYKEASQVQVLPEGWKEGDAIPEAPAATA
jgi:FKBP-type peptidyl-prolyl cis-trans isomerase